jgi:hypothetical protein
MFRESVVRGMCSESEHRGMCSESEHRGMCSESEHRGMCSESEHRGMCMYTCTSIVPALKCNKEECAVDLSVRLRTYGCTHARMHSCACVCAYTFEYARHL